MPRTPPTKSGGAYQLKDFISRVNEVKADVRQTSRTNEENWALLQAHNAKKAAEKKKQTERLARQKEVEDDLKGWVIVGKTEAEKKMEKDGLKQ
jgi:hypothetical protein